ncbi:MAG: protoheme IX farnesyltransferase [Pseudomonadota bacterium]
MADDSKIAPDEAGEGIFTGEMHTPSSEERKARGRRNVAIALAVVGFVVLIYLTTVFRLMDNVSGAVGS